MENSIKGSRKRVQFALARRVRQGCSLPPPPSLQSCIGLLQNFVFEFRKIFTKFLISCSAKFFLNFAKIKIILSKFRVLQNFNKIIFNFAKLEENFTKLKISQLFFRNCENKYFAATLLLQNLLSATHPPLLSAKRFFNAARQCYFDMKTNKEPCFSLLSIIILWLQLNKIIWIID